MIEVTLKIDGKEYPNATYSMKYDERLDRDLESAKVSISKSHVKQFKPFTPVELIIKDERGETQSKDYVICEDKYKTSPLFEGVYSHDLTLIEPVKILENFQLESLTNRNPSPYIYTANAVDVEVTYGRDVTRDFKIDLAKANVKTPKDDKTLSFNLRDCLYFEGEKVSGRTADDIYGESYIKNTTTGQKISISARADEPINIDIDLVYGENNFSFDLGFLTPSSLQAYVYTKGTFIITQVDNHYPRAPHTNGYIIERMLDLVEPILLGEDQTTRINKPRFAFPHDGYTEQQQELLFVDTAPEYTFSRQNVLEALRVIGGNIHAEPYLDKDENGEFTIIRFFFYGDSDYATYIADNGTTKRLSEYNFEEESGSYSLENSATAIDTYAENVVNRMEWQYATIASPFELGKSTLRSETNYIRFEANSAVCFRTAFPIYQIQGFYYYDKDGKQYDLTAYVYEESIYNAYLDEHTQAYPTSKAYGLYYTQSGKNVKGFFYKNRDIQGGIWDKYAIINILDKAGAKPQATLSFYKSMKFRLDYIPIYEERFCASKTNINEWLPIPRSINNTQSANLAEMRYLGENAKGTIERTGNPERSVTFTCKRLSTIPKQGQLFDKDYYISSIATELMIDKFKVTLGLTKNFNRMSEYTNITSYKRMFNVDDKMAEDRHSLYRDYMIIHEGTKIPDDTVRAMNKTYLGVDFIQAVRYTFDRSGTEWQDSVYNARYIMWTGYTAKNVELKTVVLPIVASAFANTVSFTWDMTDNFSAGQQLVTDMTTESKFTKEVQYTDLWGEVHHEHWNIRSGELSIGNDEKADLLPEFSGTDNNKTIAGCRKYISGWKHKYVLKRKDSGETLKESYSVEFVTDSNDIIISSEMARQNIAVRLYRLKDNGQLPKIYLVVLDEYINKFNPTINRDKWSTMEKYEVGNIVTITEYNLDKDIYYLRFNGANAQNSGKSWAYVLEPYEGKHVTIEDEYGNITDYIEKLGGTVLFGKNVYDGINAGNKVGDVRMYPCGSVETYLKLKK